MMQDFGYKYFKTLDLLMGEVQRDIYFEIVRNIYIYIYINVVDFYFFDDVEPSQGKTL